MIDWSQPGRSLLEDTKYRKKPLSVNTRRRIARGLERFGGPLASLYIRLLDLPETNGTSGPGDSVVVPFILSRLSENGNTRVHSIENPAPTVTTRGADYLVEAEAKLIPESDRQQKSEPFVGANRNNNVPKGIDHPIPTVTTANGGGSFLVEPEAESFLLGQQSGGALRPSDQLRVQ